MFKLNDTVKSLKTGKYGIIQGEMCDNVTFLFYYGTGYEHLKSNEMEHATDDKLSFRKDLYEIR